MIESSPASLDLLEQPGRTDGNAQGAEAERIFIGLGANLGDRLSTLRRTRRALDELPGTQVVACSALFRTRPLQASGPEFLNAVVELRSRLSPLALLTAMQAIEAAHGRERPFPNAPRTLDLDLLIFGQRVSNAALLCLPHPRLHLRGFVLAPLLELAPQWSLPGVGLLMPWFRQAAGQGVQRLEQDWTWN